MYIYIYIVLKEFYEFPNILKLFETRWGSSEGGSPEGWVPPGGIAPWGDPLWLLMVSIGSL